MDSTVRSQEDLDNFKRLLILKAAQIIVQSRLADKAHTKCDPYKRDWFNLSINDKETVAKESKLVLDTDVSSRSPFCVEISLKTAEGDKLVLETWCLGTLPDQCDPSIHLQYTIYSRMGILLKTLLSVTRVMPAYRLSRRQGEDSYSFYYCIYKGEPRLHNLGDGLKQLRVGQLATPFGTIYISVSYRTKMTISPQNNGRENSIMVKSDHFNPDLSPRHARYQQNDDKSASLSETIKVGAFADTTHLIQNASPKDSDISNIPFSNLLVPRRQSPPKPSPTQVTPKVTENTAEEDEGNGNITPKCQSREDSRRSSISGNEDFIMVDLKTPFAVGNANSDLSAFYQECQSPPPLKTFSNQPTLAEQVKDITKTLEVLETSMREYDEMLTSLCVSENNN